MRSMIWICLAALMITLDVGTAAHAQQSTTVENFSGGPVYVSHALITYTEGGDFGMSIPLKYLDVKGWTFIPSGGRAQFPKASDGNAYLCVVRGNSTQMTLNGPSFKNWASLASFAGRRQLENNGKPVNDRGSLVADGREVPQDANPVDYGWKIYDFTTVKYDRFILPLENPQLQAAPQPQPVPQPQPEPQPYPQPQPQPQPQPEPQPFPQPQPVPQPQPSSVRFVNPTNGPLRFSVRSVGSPQWIEFVVNVGQFTEVTFSGIPEITFFNGQVVAAGVVPLNSVQVFGWENGRLILNASQ